MKFLLVIDVADDVANNYKALTVNYDLRGDYGEWDESIKYVEDCPLKPMPQKLHESRPMYGGSKDIVIGARIDEYAKGWNACIDEILGDTE